MLSGPVVYFCFNVFALFIVFVVLLFFQVILLYLYFAIIFPSCIILNENELYISGDSIKTFRTLEINILKTNKYNNSNFWVLLIYYVVNIRYTFHNDTSNTS